MMAEHRGFWMSGGREPVMKVLIGAPSGYCPTGSIGYRRQDRSLVELTRFQLRKMVFDDDKVAEHFGLETARLLIDCFIREFAMARYQAEKRRIRENRFRR